MSDDHLRRILDALDALAHAGDPDEAAHAVLDAAVRVASADSALMTRLDRCGAAAWAWPSGFINDGQRSTFEIVNATDPWPLATHTRAGPGLALRISDIWSPPRYRASSMYGELFRYLSVRHQVAFSIPTATDHCLCVTLQRSGSDFTDAECDDLNSLRPCLETAARRSPPRYGPVAVCPCPDGLTRRERDTLHLAAGGLTDQQIARRLGISTLTVSKHLQHIYRKTGTTNRTQAAACIHEPAASLPAAVDAFVSAAGADVGTVMTEGGW